MRFSVVIPAWRGKELLKKNLPAVLAVGADEIIVVDDDSPDNDGDWVEDYKAKLSDESLALNLRVLRNERNLGFGRTVTKGVENASGEIVILFNQDVQPSKDILKYLKEDFNDENVFGVSLAEQEYGPTQGVFRNGFMVHEQLKPVPNKLSSTFWANGGSCAVRKKYWDKLGGFNPIYDPGYWEDIDLSYRAQKRGWKILWDPRAKVVHDSESTFGGKHYDQVYKRRIQERNHLLFNWLNLGDGSLRRNFYWGLLRRILKHPGYLRILIMACIQLLRFGKRGRGGKENFNHSPVGDKEILKISN